MPTHTKRLSVCVGLQQLHDQTSEDTTGQTQTETRYPFEPFTVLSA